MAGMPALENNIIPVMHIPGDSGNHFSVLFRYLHCVEHSALALSDKVLKDSGSSFRGDDIETSVVKMYVLIFQIKEFADSASGVYQHKNDGVINI